MRIQPGLARAAFLREEGERGFQLQFWLVHDAAAGAGTPAMAAGVTDRLWEVADN
jgi:hypothetical protein